MRCSTTLVFGVGIGSLLSLLVARTAEAATFDPVLRTVDLDVHYTFPPTQQDIDLLKLNLNRAKTILCDATDGSSCGR